jgi:hypothetical protein
VPAPQNAWLYTLRVATAAFVVPQLLWLLWFVPALSALHLRGALNVEYLILLALVVWRPSWWTAALLSADLLMDFAESIAHLYYFTPRDWLAGLQYMFVLPLPRLAVYAAGVLIYLAFCIVVLHGLLGKRRHAGSVWASLVLVLVALSALAVDADHGRLHHVIASAAGQTDDVQHPYLVRMPVASLVFDGVGHSFGPADGSVWNKRLSGTMPSALSAATRGGPPAGREDVVVVLAESWGLALDGRLNQIQTAPYHSAPLASAYEVEEGTVPFAGSTNYGEARELCGSALGHVGTPAFFAACRVGAFNKAGYETIAVHGFLSKLFARAAWYRQFGFQQQVFLPTLLQSPDVHLCEGAFLGACDADVAGWLGRRLVEPNGGRPHFAFWLTLNSHLPVAPVKDAANAEACVRDGAAFSEGFCSWFLHSLLVHESVARLAMTPGLRPTIFVIVGDHPPPFTNRALMNKFSMQAVPYVILRPRDAQEALAHNKTAQP